MNQIDAVVHSKILVYTYATKAPKCMSSIRLRNASDVVIYGIANYVRSLTIHCKTDAANYVAVWAVQKGYTVVWL